MADQEMDMLPRQVLGGAALMDRILAILPEAVIESEKLRSAEFREQIRRFREEIHAQKPIDLTAQKALDLCRDYFSRAKVYQVERESGYVETIAVLREALTQLASGSERFNAELTLSSDRFKKVLEVEDIREIKSAIRGELENLRRAIEEKRKQDEANLSQMSQRIEALEQKLHRAKDEAAMDPLTRVANRGSFDATIARWVKEHEQSGAPFALALADIDDFKIINDTYGHPIGDRALMETAQVFARAVRPTDFVARYGGEEFMILLEGISLEMAIQRMEHIVRTIAGYRFRFEEGSLQFTISCGIAEFTSGDTVSNLIQRSDAALYEAKRKGKNRVASRRKSFLKLPWS